MHITRGVIAGAAGTVALNALTYLDMATRARPGSSMPAETAERIARAADVELAGDEATAHNRRQGLGALLGYVTGLGFGGLYGAVAGRSRPSIVTGALGLTMTAMAGANGPSILMGLTDPRSWGAQGWLEDVVPHLAYGFVTAAVFDAITDDGS